MTMSFPGICVNVIKNWTVRRGLRTRLKKRINTARAPSGKKEGAAILIFYAGINI